MSSSHAPKKRSQDGGGLGEKAQRNTTPGNPTADGYSPASHEEKFADLSAARLHIVKFFARIEYIAEKIDEAFVGQPFLPHMRADAPANRRRFNAYLEKHRQVSKLLHHAVELWMFSFGFAIVRESKPPARKRTDKGRTRKS